MTGVMTQVMSNRTRPREELRDRLYEASITLFRNKGYAAATVDEIVAGAGVAKGTFFNFFPTKLHVLRAYYGALDAEIAGCRASLDPTRPLDALDRFAEQVEQILRREDALLLELIEMALSHPAMRALDEDSGSMDIDEFAAFLQAAAGCGAIQPDLDWPAAAAALTDLWSGAMRAWRRDPQGQSLEALFGSRARLLFSGLARQRR